ncbi:MAG: N-acyl-D-amino-acid deacylase [Limisphaerales bacterium]|jgi:N-acyl-D-amino-acid deacylase
MRLNRKYDGAVAVGGVRLRAMHSRRLGVVFSFLLSVGFLPAQEFDLIIRDGRVADGSGNPLFHADVAVKDGRIAAIGRIKGKAKEEVSARGMIVAPGFIDVHSHAENITDNPLAKNFLRMGVTTIVLGNCGSSKTDVGGFFKKIEGKGFSPNVATLIGQGRVRSQIMGGSFRRPPTGKEVTRMRELVDKAMKDGAVGMSTGLIYLPGNFTKTEELIELAKVVSMHDGIYVSHMRSETRGIFKALEELFKIAREADVRAEISHIKLAGQASWGQTAQALGMIERARAEGLDVTQDQYMYPASSTGIQNRIPTWAREGGRSKFKERVADSKTKARIIAEMKESLEKYGHKNFDYAMIASYSHDSSLNGMNVMQAAKKIRKSDSLDDQIEMILEINANGGASGVFHSMSEKDLIAYLQHPNTMIAADSGIRLWQKGVPHPRGYGNNARCLARYVREKKILRMEDAIRRMTSLPATTFRMKDRGALRVGAWADIVVFNPKTIQDNATFTDPHHYSTGFKRVYVNGVATVKDDKHTEALGGRVIRSGEE